LEQGNCVVEEEIPPSWLTDWIARNTTPGLAMEEIPPTTFDADTTPHEDTVGKIEQPLLNPHFFGRPPSADLRYAAEPGGPNSQSEHPQPMHGPPV
jgi:hypothetical protein